MIDIDSLPKSSKQILQVLALNFGEEGLKAASISELVGFSRQTVYKELEKLKRLGLVECKNLRRVERYCLANDQLKLYFIVKAGERKELFSVNGRLLTSYEIESNDRPVFYDPLFLPRKSVYGCSLLFDSIPASHFSLLQRFSENLSETHNYLGEIHWTVVDAYNVNKKNLCRIGVGVSSLLKTLAKHKKAALKMIFGVQDFFGEFVFNTYYLEARLYNNILDQVRLMILTQKIPIGKKFVIGWNQVGLLRYVEPFEVKKQKLLSEDTLTFDSSSVVAFTCDPRLKKRSIRDVILKVPPRTLRSDISGLMVSVTPGTIDDVLETQRRAKPITIDSAFKYVIKPRGPSTPLSFSPQIHCASLEID